MKKIMGLLFIIVMITACNNDKKKTEQVKTDTEVGIPNVNGNIPDTTNAINIDMDKKVTKSKDSLK